MKNAKQAIFVETYGCQMNVLDSALVADQLAALGYHLVDDDAEAGVVLLNTCAVRELSEHKVWSRLGRLGVTKRRGRRVVVGVLGCMAEREGAGIRARMPHVDIVCGPSNLDRLPSMIHNALNNGGPQISLAGHTSRRSQTLARSQDKDGIEALDLSRAFSPVQGRAQAYVRITRGCNKFCSFCVVPFTRGPEVHRPPEHIVDEVRRLVDTGIVEVTLLGQTVNHYHHQSGERTTSFADLLWLVHERVPALRRLRFITSYPRDFGDDALDVMAAAPRICRYLHVPAQSGSDRLLRRMNRGYTREDYLHLVARARARMPDICIAGDMITGFPGETESDHAASLELLQQAQLKSCFVFKYSPRPGTIAYRRLADDVPEAVKRARNVQLLAVQSAISAAHHRAQIGTNVELLVEGISKLKKTFAPVCEPEHAAAAQKDHVRLIGRTGGDEIVAFDGPPHLIGTITQVAIVGATPLTMSGRWDGGTDDHGEAHGVSESTECTTPQTLARRSLPVLQERPRT